MCPIHGHCYHIIDGVEGRKDPFSSIYCYMENAPAEIYYDFACSIYEYLYEQFNSFVLCFKYMATQLYFTLFFLQFFIAIWNKKKTALYISKKQKIILHNRC